jgi:cytochrome c
MLVDPPASRIAAEVGHHQLRGGKGAVGLGARLPAYSEQGLQLRNKSPKRRVKAKLRDGRVPATGPNQVWAMDFVHDQLFDGRKKIRILTIVDTFKLPDDEWGKTVRYGRDLITKTYALIGPEVSEADRRYSDNNLACASCHLEVGTKQFGLPFQGVYVAFPNYRARSGTVGTIEDRINECMTRSMNGRTLPLDSPEMIAIVAYLKFLSTGRPVGAPTLGRGPGRMAELTRAADPLRGKTVYAQTCAACHGDGGKGQRAGRVGDAQG